MATTFDAVRLLNRTSLRAIRQAMRSELDRFQPPATPTPAFISAIEQPFTTVDEVIDRLTTLEARLRDRDDRRAVFLTIYSRMTRDVMRGLATDHFVDAAWLRQYLITFANYYRRAFLAFERGDLDAVPDPWRIAFGTATGGDALVIQDAFLGVNAHINYDLALTVTDVGIDPNRPQKYADHRAINEILTRLVDAQQTALAELYAAGLADIDTVFGQLDESLTLLSMTEGREQAWRIAVILTDVNVPLVPTYTRWVLRATATGSALFILAPRINPTVQITLKTVERDGLTLEAILTHVDEHLAAVSPRD